MGVRTTSTPAIKNAPEAGLAEGNGSFSNLHLAVLLLVVPWVIKRMLPLVNRGGFYTYWFLFALCGVPVVIGYWTLMSTYGPRKNEKVALPGRPLEEYLEIKDLELKNQYNGDKKIPMQVFHDAFFDGKIEFKGDVLDTMELRHDWAKFNFTPELFKFVLKQFIPDIIVHSPSQDEKQVRDNYDRGDDFYEWFLGPRMVYSSGVVLDLDREETLEELIDNKLTLVCEKLALEPNDRLLDIGCGWGTLAAFAAKNYECDVTGVTLSKNQTAFGNERIKANGCDPARARILCCDYRDISAAKGHYTKIVSVDMAEHVGIRHYGTFLRQIYDLLDDDGTFVFEVNGYRPAWQYEDIICGLFMSKYIFPGADATCPLGWVITQLESAGFEVKNIDVLGVHYSATVYRSYKNWLSNKDKVIAKYGERWYRIWVFFLAYSVIVPRQGGSSAFQITLHKNLNAYHRIEGVKNHASIRVTPKREISPVV